MYLTAPNLIYYLRSRDLVSAENVVSDGFRVIESRRRNRNYRVTRGAATPIFVKQVPMVAMETMNSLKREAECYRLAKEHPEFKPLQAFVPVLVDYNPANHTIVTEFIQESENINEFHSRVGSFPEKLGGLIGKALSQCHHWSLNIVPSLDAAKIFPRTTHWMFTFLQNAETTMPAMSEGTHQAVAAMRQHPELVAGLAEMQNGWQALCLIHGDVKWDNFLTTDQGETLKVIDWELADIGDPSWDVAGVLAAYLQMMILAEGGMPKVEQGPAQLSSGKMQDIWPAINAFWHEYAAGMQLQPEQAKHQLARAIYFTAGRLLLTGIEMHMGAPQMFPVLNGLVHYARILLMNPYQAGKDLFGITESSSLSTNGKLNLGPDITSELAKAAIDELTTPSPVAPVGVVEEKVQLSDEVKDRLTAIFKNLHIHSPLSFQFGDSDPVTLAGNTTAPFPQMGNRSPLSEADQLKHQLVEALWPVLYSNTYTRTYRGESLRNQLPFHELTVRDQQFIDQLSNANSAHTHWDSSWEVYQLGASGALHVRKGDAYRLSLPGQYAFAGNPGQLPQVGSRVDLLVQTESQTAQPGFYHAFSETVPSEFDDAQLCRVYFAVTPEASLAILTYLTRELNDFRIPYQFKCLNSRTLYEQKRTDGAVLYISRRFLQSVLRIIGEGYDTFAPYLLKETPLFTKQLFPGIGVADEPGDGKSFGQSRINLVCQGIVDAWYNGKSDVESRLEAVIKQFKSAGISLGTPYLNQGNIDQYEVVFYPSEVASA